MDNSLSGSTVHREDRTTTSKKEGVNAMLTSRVGIVKLTREWWAAKTTLAER
jgi:hypothetical protein